MKWPKVNDMVFFVERGAVHQGLVRSHFVVPGKITVNYVDNRTHEPTNISLPSEMLFPDRESAKASVRTSDGATRKIALADATVTVAKLSPGEYRVLACAMPGLSRTVRAASMRDAQIAALEELRETYNRVIEEIEEALASL